MLVKRKALKKQFYKYGLWTVCGDGEVRYRNTVVANVRPRMNQRGIWIDVEIIEFRLPDDLIGGRYQTLRAIQKMQMRLSSQITFNGILLKVHAKRYEEKKSTN